MSNEPVGVHDSRSTAGARRSPNAIVVLHPAVHIVKWRCVVDGHIIKLSKREIGLELPIRTAIVAFIDAAVAAYQIVPGVIGVDPYDVVVHVLRFFTEAAKRTSAVIGDHQEHIHYIDPIDFFWVGGDLSIVHRAGVEGIASLPTPASVR